MPNIECDVLIIGGGLAGCWAAIRAKEKAKRVILVEKNRVSRSGKSAFSGAGILCPYPTDDLDAWRKEIVVKGEYMADQDVVDALLTEQPDRIREMGEWGLVYERNNSGNIVRTGGLGSMTTQVVTVSSLQMMEVLRRRMEALGVIIMDHFFVTALLTSDGVYPTVGSITGCYGFNTRTGEASVINASATVITAGGLGYFYQNGDGIAMGYRAGAEVWGMEFIRTMDQMTFNGKFSGIHLITFQRLGMRLYNNLGERFMEKYFPSQKENAPRKEMAFAVMLENLEGRGPVYADLTHLNEENLQKLRTLPSTAPRVKAIERQGVDFGKDRIPFDVHSGFINQESGGIKHRPDGLTSIQGLYVAGETGGFPANGSGSVPLKLACCCVEGYRAGESAAQYAAETVIGSINEEQVRFLKEETYGPLLKKTGLVPEELMDGIYEYLKPAHISIFRSEPFLKPLIKEQEHWSQEACKLRARDWHELVKVHQKRGYIECIGLVFKASLERQETRGMNLRADYPYRDDINWLKHIILKRDGELVKVSHEPVPLEKYKLKPDRLEKIPINMQWPNKFLEGAKK